MNRKLLLPARPLKDAVKHTPAIEVHSSSMHRSAMRFFAMAFAFCFVCMRVGGAIWTLNQGDGTLTRVGARSRRATTIALGTPGHGGDIAFGDGKVWTTMPKFPLSLIDANIDHLRCQWTGPGGDSLGIGHGAIWLTDYRAGTIERIAIKDALAHCKRPQ